MKEFLKNEWYFYIILAVPFIVACAMWDSFPAQVPIHWGIDNKPDNYAPKEIGIFMGPGFNVLLYLLFIAIPKIDSRWANYSLFKKSYTQIRIGMAVFGTVVSIIVMIASTGLDINIGKIIVFAVLGLFALLGNLMGRVRQNYFLGIRTPWTLNSEAVWRATHRVGGRFMFFGAIIAAAVAIPLEDPIWLMSLLLAFIVVGCLVPVVYSFVIYKKMEKRGEIVPDAQTIVDDNQHE